ncbi:MAG: ABC-F family ATP-binding cassette domain-containing protein [Defluviitaleaceae bacterium]|nr:ABC-F family ATP-binding cassette domain-containing protein [Defluviitaleaceae bacterium]
MILTVSNLSKGFNKEILKNVSFSVAEKEKAALIGINGAGKSTVLKILTGELSQDLGEITLKQNTKLGYLKQTHTELENTILEELTSVFSGLINIEKEIEQITFEISEKGGKEELIIKLDKLNEKYERQGGFLYKSQINGVIKGLGLDANSKIGNLSGGQRRVVSMARLLLSKNDLLLLDEPTNHLDLDTIMWLEDYLKNYDGAVLIVSHDRYFMNRLVTKIIEIEHGETEIYNGNYDTYLKEKLARQEIKKHHYETNRNQIKKMEDSIALLKSFGREKQVKRARSKEKALDRMEKLEDVKEVKTAKINFHINKTTGNDVLTVRNLTTYIGDTIIAKNINFDIKRGERVALIGPVGIGKTTLFNNLLEKDWNDSDEVIFGTNVQIETYDQHHDKKLNPQNTIFEEVHNAYPHLLNLDIRNALASFLFIGDDVFKEIGSLSGGEKARVLLTIMSLSGANVLMLDEPTNHLDINTKTILEEALKNYEGTVFYISHDRYFINETATKVLNLTENGTKEYLGNYDYYLEKVYEAELYFSSQFSNSENDNFEFLQNKNISKQKNSEENKSDNTSFLQSKLKAAKVGSGKEEYEQKKKQEAEKRSIKNKLKSIESKIENLEQNLTDLETQLQNEQDHTKLASIFSEKEMKEAELIELYEQWEILNN